MTAIEMTEKLQVTTGLYTQLITEAGPNCQDQT